MRKVVQIKLSTTSLEENSRNIFNDVRFPVYQNKERERAIFLVLDISQLK